jgi:glycerophosphoryl diester phosphodiesterase
MEQPPATPDLVAHMATWSGAHRPNSLPAVLECVDAGVRRVELDVHSLDGDDWIVSHDRRLEAETTGSGPIGRATPDDIRAARFRDGAGGRPALLSEVVEAVRGAAIELQLDLKDWRPMPEARLRPLGRIVAPLGPRVIVSTGQDWNLRRLREHAPDVRYGFDPGHYLDYAVEGSPFFLPRTMGAYGYRDDHPLAFGRTEETADYLRERFEILHVAAPDAREYFLDWRLVLQMLDDGFDAAAWLHARGIGANVWTLDVAPEREDAQARFHAFARLAAAGIDRVTTNTGPAWRRLLATAGVSGA